jgi:DNA-binding HxlR family transcriptional regulator
MRKEAYQNEEPSCPTEVTVGVIGGKWKTLILTFLLPGPRRFGEISRFLPQGKRQNSEKNLAWRPLVGYVCGKQLFE